MNTLRNGNNMSTSLQEDLAQYGLDRQRAVEGVSKSKDLAGMFGISHRGTETVMYFPKDNITELGNKYGMDLAVVAPNTSDTFDMLTPAFGERLNMKEPRTIRNYLRKLLESI